MLVCPLPAEELAKAPDSDATKASGQAVDPSSKAGVNEGYHILLDMAFTPSNLDEEIFNNLWRSWPEPKRSEAEKATPEVRREMLFSHYGLMHAPGRENDIPMQFTPDGKGGWSMNCFLCHGGKVAGKVILGTPNTHIALQSITRDTFLTKQLLGRHTGASEAGALFVPLGGSNGTTNAIIFGVVLAAQRDEDLNYHPEYPLPKTIIHNDHDAPPWWHVHRKKYLYADGFAGKGHRALMQFAMAPSNGADFFRDNEKHFKKIMTWIESLEAPKYPFEINQDLADVGRKIFNNTCAECHGTYGPDGSWPEKIIPLDVVNTDPARWESLTPEMRASYEKNWFSNYGEKKAITEPVGYVAQPLDGIWASAPYLHNGSVPTLWHMLHPDQRPAVWKRTENGYDQARVGLEVEQFESLPEGVRGAERREYFDTSKFAKSAQGHDFPDVLNEDEKVALLEYLKTL
jgi:mono/diheme cytochrome c family protein